MTQGIILLKALMLLDIFNIINSHTETQSTLTQNRFPKNTH